MDNFVFQNTKSFLVVGQRKVGEEILPAQNILLHYGGGSIKTGRTTGY